MTPRYFGSTLFPEHMDEHYRIISGQPLLVTDVKVPDESSDALVKDGIAAIWVNDLKERGLRGQGTSIAQCYRLVIPGMIMSRHIFQGLRRPLYCDGSKDSDKTKLIYSRRPSFDYGTKPGPDGFAVSVRRPVPAGMTFVVITSPNDKHRDKFPEIDIWIDHWNWTKEDAGLQEAPVNWVDRYDSKIFSLSVGGGLL